MLTEAPTNLTKTGYAYTRLREMVLTGDLEPGSTLQQGKLATQLGVSTTPLREAIRRLAAEGLINLAEHKDARVTDVSSAEATGLLQVRERLDPLAIRLAATERTDDELALILEAERHLRPISSEGTVEALLAHRHFHRTIYQASHNQVLIDLLERLWDKADRYRLIGLRSQQDTESDSERVAAEHRELADAVEKQDPERAEAAMLQHIRGSLGRRAIDALTD